MELVLVQDGVTGVRMAGGQPLCEQKAVFI